MMKSVRPPAPQWLLDNYEKWGRQYRDKRANPDKKNKFQWAAYCRQKVNVLLMPLLRDMTQKHCSFCDCRLRRETIEHFRPVSKYPLEAYLWDNLFICCFDCQDKYDEYDDKLLKPDAADYEFRRYFFYDFATGEIRPNKRANALDQERAETTIRLYKLNELDLPEQRKQWSDNWQTLRNNELDALPFRFVFAMVAAPSR
jgi:uncharacterized protein (TIGR02646 family)